MKDSEKPMHAFMLSLIAGVLILLGDPAVVMIGAVFGSYGHHMISGYLSYKETVGTGLLYWLMVSLEVIFGVLVMVSAIMLNKRPQEHISWGLLIILFSVLSVFGSTMGCLGIGLTLGLIGGLLSITWKPIDARRVPVRNQSPL
jgi:hypothetical protein